ncbi:MAG: 16S rRNA processing protein RimM [Spirochaetes bacterium]|nr:16S rRNA processing protein RimM [Spirochaetota bacterium]
MKYLKIGFIKKSHGFKGFLKILPLTENINRYKRLDKIYLKIKNHYQEEEIEKTIIANNTVLIKFKNYNNNNEVEKLKSLYIYILREEGIALDDGEYYTQDLIDCVFYFENKIVGKVINMVNFGTCDLFIVKNDFEEIYYPFLSRYIDFIDVENKKIIINQFEGFFT